jgi:hypothetical protein
MEDRINTYFPGIVIPKRSGIPLFVQAIETTRPGISPALKGY